MKYNIKEKIVAKIHTAILGNHISNSITTIDKNDVKIQAGINESIIKSAMITAYSSPSVSSYLALKFAMKKTML